MKKGDDRHSLKFGLLKKNIRLGARILFWLNLLTLGTRFLTSLFWYCHCNREFSIVKDGVPFAMAIDGTLFVLIAWLLQCIMKHPQPQLWYGVLLVYSLFIVACGFQPLALSCKEASVDMSCRLDFREQCHSQAFTFIQLLTGWILLTPYLVPSVTGMYSNWLLIWALYPGPVIVARYVFGKELRYSFLNMALTVFFLMGVSYVAMRRKHLVQEEQKYSLALDVKQRDLSIRLYGFLRYMMPNHVIIPMLKQPGNIIADHLDCVSILFIVLHDFDQLTHACSPQDLMEFLNQHFTAFDKICAKHGVTKIETVREEHVSAVGVTPEDQAAQRSKGHSKILGRLVKAAAEILALQESSALDGKSVLFKMGMHTGSVVAGVAGQKLPRFRMFGDTMNTAARMMQKSLPGQLQFGEATYKVLPSWVATESRGWVEMKGKGQVKTYLLSKTWKGQSSSIGQLLPLPSQDSLGSTGESEHVRRSLDFLQLHRGKGRPPRVANTNFDEVLNSMTDRDDVTSTCTLNGGTRKAEEQEEAFQLWYHSLFFMREFGVRLWRCLRFGVGIFMLEISVLLVGLRESTQAGLNTQFEQLVPFLVMRLLATLFILGWLAWYQGWLARCKSGDSAKRSEMHPKVFQRRLLFTILAVAMLIFFSYETLPFDTKAQDWSKNNYHSHLRVPAYTAISFVKLVSVAMYTMTTTTFPLLFLPHCSFVVLAAVLAFTNVLIEKGNASTIFSHLGRIAFVLISALHAFGAWMSERAARRRFQSKQVMLCLRDRLESTLNTLMPPLVIEELRCTPLTRVLPSHRYLRATVLQADLVGFTALASVRPPAEVFSIIGDIFGQFDDLTDLHEIYKVETVGDAYIAGQAEKPLTHRNSPLSVVLMALDMVAVVLDWSSERGEELTCRVGVHIGECVGGIVGSEMQRYHLFGKLISEVEVLESTAPSSQVQVSGPVKDAVEVELRNQALLVSYGSVGFQPRGSQMLTTSKGEAHSCEAVGGPTFLASFQR